MPIAPVAKRSRSKQEHDSDLDSVGPRQEVAKIHIIMEKSPQAPNRASAMM
jgi:hypothetical protein